MLENGVLLVGYFIPLRRILLPSQILQKIRSNVLIFLNLNHQILCNPVWPQIFLLEISKIATGICNTLFYPLMLHPTHFSPQKWNSFCGLQFWLPKIPPSKTKRKSDQRRMQIFSESVLLFLLVWSVVDLMTQFNFRTELYNIHIFNNFLSIFFLIDSDKDTSTYRKKIVWTVLRIIFSTPSITDTFVWTLQ